MSLAKYRAIDLFILALIMCGLEAVCLFGLAKFDTTFAVSISTTVILIAIIRWNEWGLILAALGGAFSAWFVNYLFLGMGLYLEPLTIYTVGNLFIALVLFYLKPTIKKENGLHAASIVIYVIIGFASIILGRSIIAVCFGNNFFNYLIKQVVAESLNILFALIILFIANRQESLLRNQKNYFLEVRLGGKDEK